MKKTIIGVVTAVSGLVFAGVAFADAEQCEKASKNAAFYQSKAAALWSAYGGCRGVEWMGGKVKSHCEDIHREAINFQNKANAWHNEFVKYCVKG